MKNKIIYEICTLLACYLMLACSPQDKDQYALEELQTITPEMVDFSMIATAKSNNELQFKNTSSINAPVALSWDLGNGANASGETVTAQYPEKGEYTVTLSVHTAGGQTVSKSKILRLEHDDFGLINTPAYRNLTGGVENTTGKTWVFDQYNPGHFGVGPADADGPEWWSAPPEAKNGCSLYKQRFTFYQTGTRIKWENNGYIYTNAAGVSALGNPTGIIDNPGGVGDFDVPYSPQESGYTFKLNEENMTLELSGNAFFGFYTGTSVFKISALTETELYLKCVSSVEPGNSWWFRLIPQELNVPEAPIIKTPQSIPLFEDFEKDKYNVNFEPEMMGNLTKAGYNNPAPVPINESSKVFLYQKSSEFYSNLSFVATDYKFDLSTQNKISLMVYIPSYNNYERENTVVGDWIVEKRLRPQVAVKLQDMDKGGDGWKTQTEIIKTDLELNKWLLLEFDFGHVKERTDYDKIVIQFGGEGHSGEGIFFFDNFQFKK